MMIRHGTKMNRSQRNSHTRKNCNGKMYFNNLIKFTNLIFAILNWSLCRAEPCRAVMCVRVYLFHNFSFVNLFRFVLRWVCTVHVFVFYFTQQIRSYSKRTSSGSASFFSFFSLSQYVVAVFFVLSPFVSDLHQSVVAMHFVVVAVVVFALAPLVSLIISQSYASMHLFPLVYIL